MSLFGVAPKLLLCHRCEEPLENHVDGDCPKQKVSRRFFMGLLGAAAATTALANVLPNVVIEAAAPEQLVVAAAPRVHVQGPVELSGTLHSFFWEKEGTLQDVQNHINELAQREQRPIIARVKDTKAGRMDILYGDPNPKGRR